MEYTIIERAPDAFQQPIPSGHIAMMCQRAFGEERQIESAKELSGGLYNNTYLIRISGMQPIILRVGPHRTRQFRIESNLMRNEQASLPFLAPISPLLPKILMADFTHQILEREFLFQTYMEGRAMGSDHGDVHVRREKGALEATWQYRQEDTCRPRWALW